MCCPQCCCDPDPISVGTPWFSGAPLSHSQLPLLLSSASQKNLLSYCEQAEPHLSQSLTWNGASLVAQRVKHLPIMRETRVQSLGREDLLGKEMATRNGTSETEELEHKESVLLARTSRVSKDDSGLSLLTARIDDLSWAQKSTF